jgi:hypothetical protein
VHRLRVHVAEGVSAAQSTRRTGSRRYRAAPARSALNGTSAAINLRAMPHPGASVIADRSGDVMVCPLNSLE